MNTVYDVPAATPPAEGVIPSTPVEQAARPGIVGVVPVEPFGFEVWRRLVMMVVRRLLGCRRASPESGARPQDGGQHQRPSGPVSHQRRLPFRYGNSPRSRVASATRSRPSATAARRRGTFSMADFCQVASNARSIVSRCRVENTPDSQA